jgi:hypothetical protein
MKRNKSVESTRISKQSQKHQNYLKQHKITFYEADKMLIVIEAQKSF